MRRVWAMPSAETFDIEPIHNFVWKYLHQAKVSIDPFARNRRWANYTNDLNPNTNAEFHMEAEEFLLMLKSRGTVADVAIFDPPYSLRQCCEVYEGVGRTVTQQDTQVFGRWKTHKDVLGQLIAPAGVVLSFGWNSTGMGRRRGFDIEELLLVNHGSAHNDTICLAERRIQPGLFGGEPPCERS